MNDIELLTPKQAAEFLKITPAALSRFRFEKRGPAFLRVGRLVRYAKRDLEKYLQANRQGMEEGAN
jgi:predicted transcriptional regulator